MTSSLDDIRVVDLSQNIAGPYCTQILADLGADVIKVEPPGGDPARAWGPPFWGDDPPLFLVANRNKRSIVIDLKSDRGKEVLWRLTGTADVFVQAFRGGVIEALGFGPDAVRAAHPGVVYVSVTGFGTVGPLKDLPGYDPLMQAYSGIMSLTGHPDGPPARVGGSVVDLGTGMWAALGVLSALRTRDRTGQGSHIVTALLDTALGWVSYHLAGYLATGEMPVRMGSGLAAIAPYEAFPTADGELMILAGNDASFGRLCAALGLDELAIDPRFVDNPSRARNRTELFGVVAAATVRHDTSSLFELLKGHRVPSSPIHDVREVLEDPQVEATGMVRPAPHPRVPGYRDVALPLRVDGERPEVRSAPPMAGEHTAEILAELGYEQS